MRVKGSQGESRGVKRSQGESRGVKESQGESRGVKAGHRRQTELSVCLSVSLSVCM